LRGPTSKGRGPTSKERGGERGRDRRGREGKGREGKGLKPPQSKFSGYVAARWSQKWGYIVPHTPGCAAHAYMGAFSNATHPKKIKISMILKIPV